MEQKKSKYDTNPLDPDVARRTEDVWGATGTTGEAAAPPPETQDVGGATRDIRRSPREQAREDLEAEAPTRRYDQTNLPPSYPSVFVPPVYAPPSSQSASGVHGGASATGVPPRFQQQPFNATHQSRPIPNINLPENVVMMLPYLPFPVVGAVIAAVILFLLPRSEPRSRFHAAQGLALHLIVLAVSVLAGLADDILSGPANVALTVASSAFNIAAFVFFIISMIRVYKGQPHVVAPLSDITRWLNEKVEPRKP